MVISKVKKVLKSFSIGFILLGSFALNSHSEPCDDSLTGTTNNDSTYNSEMQENEFQQDLGEFFPDSQPRIDSLGWNTQRINAGHFNPDSLTDTARVVLVDSSLGKFFVPPFKNCITSNFGQRKYLWHFGTDIRLSTGDTVRAAFDGVVRVREYDKHGYGIVIVVRHSGGLETIYGHLSSTLLKPNQIVKAGDLIGLGGNTGHSTGSHLHFEVRYCGVPFDPNHIIDFNTFTLKQDTLTLTKDDFAYYVNLKKVKWYVIKKGETLGKIARCFHTTVKALCKANRITPRTVLHKGERIAIKSVVRIDTES